MLPRFTHMKSMFLVILVPKIENCFGRWKLVRKSVELNVASVLIWPRTAFVECVLFVFGIPEVANLLGSMDLGAECVELQIAPRFIWPGVTRMKCVLFVSVVPKIVYGSRHRAEMVPALTHSLRASLF